MTTETTSFPFKTSDLFGGTAIDSTSEKGLNPETVLRDSDLNFTVEMRDMYYAGESFDENMEARQTFSNVAHGQIAVKVDNDTAEESPLHFHGQQFAPHQPSDLLNLAKPFLAEGDATISSAGYFDDCRKIFLVLDIHCQPVEVRPGDVLEPKLLLWDSFDGSSGQMTRPFGFRPSCLNQSEIIFGAGKKRSVRHTSTVVERAKEVRNSLDLASRTFEDRANTFRRLGKRNLSRVELVDYIRGVMGTRATLEKIAEQVERGEDPSKVAGQDEIERLFEEGPGCDLAGSTAWGAYNAVTHYLGYTCTNKAGQSKRAESAFFGERRKQNVRALQVAEQMFAGV